MTYALIVEGTVEQYPYTFAMLRMDNPQVSFPRDAEQLRLADFGLVQVHEINRPAPSDPITKNVVEGTPALAGNGRWQQVWEEVDATPEQIAQRQQSSADHVARLSVKADAFVGNFIEMTPAEVSAYIGTNVTNLASAKAVIEKLALMVLLLARREFRE